MPQELRHQYHMHTIPCWIPNANANTIKVSLLWLWSLQVFANPKLCTQTLKFSYLIILICKSFGTREGEKNHKMVEETENEGKRIKKITWSGNFVIETICKFAFSFYHWFTLTLKLKANDASNVLIARERFASFFFCSSSSSLENTPFERYEQKHCK